MNTPFYDQMAAACRRGPRFFVPGHKGNPAAIPFMGPALHWDLTEVEGAGDLSHPTGALAESEANMAHVYGSGATLYSASGSSSCIGAMLTLFAAPGARVVMARGCHVAAVRALAFLDLQPVWVPLAEGRPAPADIDAALAESGAKAVYLTSPDYYGRLADVAGAAEVCRRHGAALLVDGAQGGHLRFFEGETVAPGAAPQSLHPLALGADACCDSAHKALPCLTPAALLHLRDAAPAGAARAALNLYSSTSPSYLVLASLDLAAGLLLSDPPDFPATAARLAEAAAALPALVQPCDDPLRLMLWPAGAGLSYAAVHDGLLAAGMAAEYADGERLVLMASPWNSPEDFAALAAALKALARPAGAAPPTRRQGAGPAAPHSPPAQSLPPPKARCTVRQALFGPKETLPTAAAAGRVMAGLHAPCPPGVPLVLPGEEISHEAVRALVSGGILHLDVVK